MLNNLVEGGTFRPVKVNDSMTEFLLAFHNKDGKSFQFEINENNEIYGVQMSFSYLYSIEESAKWAERFAEVCNKLMSAAAERKLYEAVLEEYKKKNKG